MDSTSSKWEVMVEARAAAVLTARFNGSGNFFFTGGEDRVIRLWDTRNGNLLTSFPELELEHEIRDVCITKDDSKLSSCGGDEQVLYWDLSTQCLVRKFGGHNDEVNAVKFNESGSVIASGDSCVRLWDCRSHTSQPIQIFDTFNNSVTSLYVRTTEIFAGSLDGSVQKFDLRNKTRLFFDLGSPVKCISMGNTGTCIVASRLDSTFQLLHVKPRSIRKGGTYKGHTCESSKVLGCCFTKDTTHVVGGSEDGRIFIWDLVSKKVVSKIDAHSSAVTSVDYHPTDDCMVSASMDGSVVLWKDPM
ncbi:transducin/WD40 repeat-like superfamily protein [Artemisia annua]|uniref:Transducin/WD40 repeat-like superfamily protein n=1 Tax=Artemisia annua TaxID=35608 RepID=A0A2U1Q0E5_ARTAN|nr:transducin/WD40 repeat-like superfamily protein [Artemisia annua]